MNGLKQRDALFPLLFNFALKHATMRVQVNQEGLKLNQILVYADDNILGGSVHTMKKNTKALVVAGMEIELEVNADKTKYMVMYPDQNVGRSHNIKTDNCSFERVEQFKYLGTTLMNQNSVQEEIKSRLNSRTACYHLVQNLLSSSLLFKNIKIKIHKTIISPSVWYGCETWSHTLREELRLGLFENWVLRRMFGPKRDNVTGQLRKLHNEEFNYLYSSSHIIQVIKSRRMRWAKHVVHLEKRCIRDFGEET